ncbi:hypothetical protein FU658_13105 [Alkalisalibacterium limincola]|uniref:Type II secretion system protein GspC N-terminal domain-containing protein n=1 Tax=Alkalisalibacterium limincola TaxID=2699169 RepID=A0A5C8KH63_9GAMM|nr:hypothetical protein FU658_13105 [Alkalisalibacterium limincola]
MTAMADSIASLGANRALPQGVTLVLAAVCVVLAARLVWLVLAGPTLPAPEASLPAGGGSPTARHAASMQGLFGPGATAAQAVETAPASRSGLVLRGTVAPPTRPGAWPSSPRAKGPPIAPTAPATAFRQARACAKCTPTGY